MLEIASKTWKIHELISVQNHLQSLHSPFCYQFFIYALFVYRFAFSETLKQMYGVRSSQEFLPPMPSDGRTWSVMQSWALPTRSFLEFVMFSRSARSFSYLCDSVVQKFIHWLTVVDNFPYLQNVYRCTRCANVR